MYGSQFIEVFCRYQENETHTYNTQHAAQVIVLNLQVPLLMFTYPVPKAPNPRLCANSSTHVVIIARVDEDVETKVAVDEIVVVGRHGFQPIRLLVPTYIGRKRYDAKTNTRCTVCTKYTVTRRYTIATTFYLKDLLQSTQLIEGLTCKAALTDSWFRYEVM